jgi:GT2 family glycosyltransferase
VPADPSVGAVLIGRNEGERLRRCLESIRGRAVAVVYVDSGSIDGSAVLARSFGAEVVELAVDRPFTAARARNAGFGRLMELVPTVELVQFVDGDCRVVEGWIATAAAALRARPLVGVVCGRRREAFPNASIYNRLCDMEWDTPVGDARSCGGDAMMRVGAFKAVGGFNPDVIAGEEPELCVRLRAAGWGVVRLDAEMTLHDAAMTRFSQWRRRTVRGGHGYAEGAARHGRPPERHYVRELRSIAFWGGVLPLLALATAWPSRGTSVILLIGMYSTQGWRIARDRMARGATPADAHLYGLFTIMGKTPQLLGVLRFWLNRARGRRAAIIEYKDAVPPPPAPSARAS